MKITVLGASGFIGGHLVAALRKRGDEVTTASLRDVSAAARACEGADAVVNLAGAPVAGKRWTAAYKDEIRRSRVDLTRELLAQLRTLGAPPKAYVSSSAIGYYGTSETATFVESSPPGDDFLAQTCVAWEAAAHEAESLGMRVAIVRNGIVLGTDGGALAQILPPFKAGLGGPIASGKQWYSWVHIDDTVGLYTAAIDGLSGVINGTAPAPVTNRVFTETLAKTIHRPALAPVPAFAMQLLFGEGAMVVTKGQRVLPERTQQLGYTFRYAVLEDAFKQLLG